MPTESVSTRNSSVILNRNVFPALSDFFPEIKKTLIERSSAFGIKNKPKAVWVRMVSNSRPRSNSGKIRPFQYVLMGGGTLTANGNLKAGMEMYNYTRTAQYQQEAIESRQIYSTVYPKRVVQTVEVGTNGYFRPTPGIDSISVTTKGDYGSFRKTTVSWTAPSIIDLEELAPYFLTTGASMLVDWGWADVNVNLISINVGSNYESTIIDYFKNPYKIFDNHILKSNGKYDAVVGTVTNFNYDLNEDGTYSCTTEVTSMGELMLGVNIDKQFRYTDPNDKNRKKSIKEFLYNNLDKEMIELAKQFPSQVIEVDSDFLSRIGKSSSEQVGGNAVSPYYVSWGFLEDQIVNRFLAIVPKGDITNPIFKLNSKDVVISNDPVLFSTDPAVLLILKTGFTRRDTGADISNVNTGYNFNYAGDSHSGVIRNLFVNLEIIKQAFNESDTLKDAILTILNQMNAAAVNIWNFELRTDPLDENSLKVVDLNFSPIKTPNDENILRIGNFDGKGIATNISLSSKMTNQLAAKFLVGKNKDAEAHNAVFNDDQDSGITTLYNTHYDIIFKDLIHNSPESDGSGADNAADSNNAQRNPNMLTDKELSDSLEDGVDVERVNENINFLIYDARVRRELSEYIRRKTVENKRRHQVLFPLEVTATLDGISGILPGTIFKIDDIPHIYRDNGVFQVIGLEHSISSDWKTTIRAIFRVTKFSSSELRSTPVNLSQRLRDKFEDKYWERAVRG